MNAQVTGEQAGELRMRPMESSAVLFCYGLGQIDHHLFQVPDRSGFTRQAKACLHCNRAAFF